MAPHYAIVGLVLNYYAVMSPSMEDWTLGTDITGWRAQTACLLQRLRAWHGRASAKAQFQEVLAVLSNPARKPLVSQLLPLSPAARQQWEQHGVEGVVEGV